MNIEETKEKKSENVADMISYVDIPLKIQVYIDVNWDSLNINPFLLEDLSHNQGLFFYLIYQFQNKQYMKHLKINGEKYNNIVKQIGQMYFDVEYHNVTHALDVCQTMQYLVSQCEFQKVGKMNSLDQLAVLLASASHDILHPGVDNQFLVNSVHNVTVKYNNRSVLQNYHSAQFFKVLYKPDHDILYHLSKKENLYFRKVYVEMLLATDISVHFVDLHNLNSSFARTGIYYILVLDEWDPSGKHKQMCLNAMLHAADLSNPIKSKSIYFKWIDLQMKELFG